MRIKCAPFSWSPRQEKMLRRCQTCLKVSCHLSKAEHGGARRKKRGRFSLNIHKCFNRVVPKSSQGEFVYVTGVGCCEQTASMLSSCLEKKRMSSLVKAVRALAGLLTGNAPAAAAGSCRRARGTGACHFIHFQR